jgi:hypothetical protein
MEAVMKIPDELKIPAIVFSLEAVLLFGIGMIFLVLAPG